jgi:hypothetical protein
MPRVATQKALAVPDHFVTNWAKFSKSFIDYHSHLVGLGGTLRIYDGLLFLHHRAFLTLPQN